MGYTHARGCLVMRSMKQILLAALLTLTYFLPARAQLEFSDSLRISLLTCSPGPDAYERFGHTGLRIQDQRNPRPTTSWGLNIHATSSKDTASADWE